MKSWYQAVDTSIEMYIKQEIAYEIHKDIEDLIFFSSYTICYEVFKEATEKLKYSLQEKMAEIDIAAYEEIKIFLKKYHLRPATTKKKQFYIAGELLRAHVQINEALMEHFSTLHKKAHSFDYLQSRTDEIYKLLQDDSLDKM